MQHGELVLHQKSGEVIGKVKVSMKIDLPDEMMQLLVNDISKGVEHWAGRIIMYSHNK